MPKTARERALEVLAALYPDQATRDLRLTELGDAGLETLGGSVLRHDDYSRSMNELQTQRQGVAAKEAETTAHYESLRDWYEQKQADLAELDQLRKGLTGDPAKPNGTGDPAKPTPAA